MSLDLSSLFSLPKDDEPDPTPAPAPKAAPIPVKKKPTSSPSNSSISALIPIEPGTYRITNVASGTSIVSYDEGAVCWQRENSESQYWVVHRLGFGCQFENCGTGWYLCVGYTDVGTQLYYSRCPTTWELRQDPEDSNTYMIKCPGTRDRIVELDGWGSGRNATKLLIQSEDGWKPHRRWRFEHLSDDTSIMNGVVSIRISSKENKIAILEKQLAQKAKKLAEIEQNLKEKDKKNRRTNCNFG